MAENESSSGDINENINRKSIKRFLIDIIFKIFIGFVILVLFILIIYYSQRINPHPETTVNPNNIIGSYDTNHIILIVISLALFLLVLGAFVKTIFFDHRTEFGIDKIKSKKTFILFLLVISFIGSIYVLLDVALQNIYLTIGPIDLIWTLNNALKSANLPYLTSINPVLTNRTMYALIRSYYFFVFYVFILLFPIIMFFILLTRVGRRKIFPQKKADHFIPKKKFFSAPMLLFLPFVIIPMVYISTLSFLTGDIKIASLVMAMILLLYWIYQFIKFLIKGVEITALIGYANILMIVPLIFLFFIFPVLLWTFWDLIQNNSFMQNVNLTNFTNLFPIYLNSNLFNVERVLELDFVFVVSVSAIAIGFAEGYSILSILRSIIRGVSVEKSGSIASTTSPKIIVILSKLAMAGAWLAFLWDRIGITVSSLGTYFSSFFPFFENIHFPSVFQYFKDFDFNITIPYLNFVLTVSILAIPVYYILMSSFKFLSVSLLVDKTKNDQQLFFLLTSSAFVLIITNILQDIIITAALTPGETAFIPTAIIPADFLIQFANKVLEFVESISFYAGVIVAIYALTKTLVKRIRTKKQIDQVDSQEPTATQVTT